LMQQNAQFINKNCKELRIKKLVDDQLFLCQ
jgi:hypothetical protein